MRSSRILEVIMVIIISFLITSNSFAQQPLWIADLYPDISNGYISSSAVDSAGNTYSLHYYDTPIFIETTFLNPVGDLDVLLVKKDIDGNFLWARSYGGPGEDHPFDLGIHGSSLFLTGKFDGGAILGTDTIDPIVDFTLARLDLNGDVMWADALGSNVVAGLITPVDEDRVIIAGGVESTFTFLDSTYNNPVSSPGSFVCSYTHSTQSGWVSKFGCVGTNYISGLVSDDTGFVYSTGVTFNGSEFWIGDVVHQVSSFGSSPTLLVKWDANGNSLGYHEFTGGQYVKLGYHSPSNTLFMASTGASYDYGSIQLQSIGSSDIFIIQYGTDLIPIRATQYGGTDLEQLHDLVVSNDRVYVNSTNRGIGINQGQIYNPTNNSRAVILAGFSTELLLKSMMVGNGSHFSNRATGIAVRDSLIFMSGSYSGDFWLDTLQLANHPSPGGGFQVLFVDDSDETGSHISGTIFKDNGDCLPNTPGDSLIDLFIVKLEPGPQYAFTQQGNFSFSVDTGSFSLQAIPFQYFATTFIDSCQSSLDVNIPQHNIDTAGFDFGFDLLLCTDPFVSIGQSNKRPCRPGHTYLTYGNNGTAQINNATISLIIPPGVNILSANHTYMLSGNLLTFQLGTLPPGYSGTITINDSLSCDSTIVPGESICFRASITPHASCLDTVLWDGSDIQPYSDCTSGFARVVLKNEGWGAMLDSAAYRVITNSQLAATGMYKLGLNDSLVLVISALDSTIRFEADQASNHPVEQIAVTIVDGCNGGVTQANALPLHDSSPSIDMDCQEVIASYDPNAKVVTPAGVGPLNQVPMDERLHFELHFQNTGTDTAFNIILIDTLSSLLDPSTISFGTSTHSYVLEFANGPGSILKFTFNDILLPDSTTDLLGSMGHVNFSASPYPGLVQGTQIINNVDIYFDYNLPVRTNTIQITYADSVISTGTPVDIWTGALVVLGDTTLCAGQPFNLTAVGHGNIHWTTNDMDQDTIALGSQLNLLSHNDTSVVVHMPSYSRVVHLNVLPTPDITLGPDTMFCMGTSIGLTVTPSMYAHLWSTGDTTSWILVDQAGVYSVIASNDVGCSSSDTVIVTEEICTGLVDAPVRTGTKLIPNPVSDRFRIEGIPGTVSTIILYDLAGREVRRYSVPEGTRTRHLSAEDLTPGAYYLHGLDSKFHTHFVLGFSKKTN